MPRLAPRTNSRSRPASTACWATSRQRIAPSPIGSWMRPNGMPSRVASRVDVAQRVQPLLARDRLAAHGHRDHAAEDDLDVVAVGQREGARARRGTSTGCGRRRRSRPLRSRRGPPEARRAGRRSGRAGRGRRTTGRGPRRPACRTGRAGACGARSARGPLPAPRAPRIARARAPRTTAWSTGPSVSNHTAERAREPRGRARHAAAATHSARNAVSSGRERRRAGELQSERRGRAAARRRSRKRA